jgi:hypothetical protein
MQTSQPIPVAAELPLAVTLQAQQWNNVLAVLLDTPHLPLPHRVVAALVQAVTDQLQQQAQQANSTIEGNGLDHDPLPRTAPVEQGDAPS